MADSASELRARNGATLRTKLRASAYTVGGPNYHKLFRFLDLDNSGWIELHEFLQLCRKSGKVARALVSDAELVKVFQYDVDSDGNGRVSLDELIKWIEKGSPSVRSEHKGTNGACGVDAGALVRPAWPHTGHPDDGKLYILQPPMHFSNRSPQRMLRAGGRTLDDGTNSKLSAFLGSSAADQKEWEDRGMPASPSPVKKRRSLGRLSSPSPNALTRSPHVTSSPITNTLPSSTSSVSGSSPTSISSRPSRLLRPRDPSLLSMPPAVSTSVVSSPLAEKLLSMTNGLAERVASASQSGENTSVEGSNTSDNRPSPEKKRVLSKLAFLIERFNEVAIISTSLEQRVYDLTDYCHELEAQLVHCRAHEQSEKRLLLENDSLRRSLSNVQQQLDLKNADFERVANAASRLVARIDRGEMLLSSMHSTIQQMALKLKEEHNMRCDAEAMALSMEDTVRSAKALSDNKSIVDKAEESIASKASSSPQDASQHDRQGSTTPLAQYQGAFQNMGHFEGYLEKLKRKRLEREQQRVVEREKRKSSAGLGARAKTAIIDHTINYGGATKRQRPSIDEQPAALRSVSSAVGALSSRPTPYAVQEEPSVKPIKSHIVSIAEHPVSRIRSETEAVPCLEVLSIKTSTKHASREPLLDEAHENSGSPDPVLEAESLQPVRAYRSPAPGWTGLDSLEELRDIHDAGQDILSRLSTLSSGSKSVGSAERRRAGRDAARLEDHVDLLTKQYHDLLAAATSDDIGSGAALMNET